MDRTVIAPYKAEEKELSERVHKKLEGLMLLFPPTEELRKCFSHDMFLKPNQTAFFHVMHYLFRIHDPVEFRKRFYWPISDKRSEASFRSTTVEYLKFLSEKHQLNWNIKSYLVVMPGGMKFITFLLDFIGFIVQEQVRLREKHLGSEMSQDELSELNIKRMERQNAFLKEYASTYVTQVDEQILNLRKKTETLKERLQNVGSVASNSFINKEFINQFNADNNRIFEEKFVNHCQNVISLEQPLNDMKESIDKFQNKASELRKDMRNLKEALQKITSKVDSNALEETLSVGVDSSDGFRMNSLAKAFVDIAPTIDNWIENVVENNIALDTTVTSELTGIKSEFLQIESQIVDFQKKHNPAQLKSKEPIQTSLDSDNLLQLKYVQTPPIKLSNAENISARLPLQDETNILDRCSNYLTNTLLHSQSRKHTKEYPQEQSSELNSTFNRSKTIDPVQLLRTIYRGSAEKSVRSKKLQSQQRHNLSLLGIKWKERQEMMFGNDPEPVTPININKTCEPINLLDNISVNEHNTNEIANQSPRTPFNKSNSIEITRIALTLSNERKTSTMLLKKASVVRKVQDASLNIQNLSTSPSGRLEPLIPVSLDAKFIEESEGIDIEGDANILNTPIRHRYNLSGLDDDAIFNTSDTILKDI